MPLVPVKPKTKSKTIALFGTQFAAALVALLLHLTDAAPLSPALLSGALVCLVMGLQGILLRFVTVSAVTDQPEVVYAPDPPTVIVEPDAVTYTHDAPIVNTGPGLKEAAEKVAKGGLVLLVLLMLGGCGASLEHAAEKAGTCLGRCALACGYQMAQDMMTCPVPEAAKVEPVEPVEAPADAVH